MPRALRVAVVVLAAMLLSLPFPAFTHAQMQTQGAVTKLGRGLINIVTGWVEIPKRVYETSQTQGAIAGWTWGMLRGIGYGFVRTAGGFYELFTFPAPAPPGYMPVMEPEYVFIDEGAKPPETDYRYR